ncbi:hypothetical protein BDN72DRAFT_740917, partial [Pluteus cervinus]
RLPRRDREDTDQYERVMLLLFRPWRSFSEFISESLHNQFNEMCDLVCLYHLKVMENMQLLHEC